jgi:hypothetical protein
MELSLAAIGRRRFIDAVGVCYLLIGYSIGSEA